MSSAAACDGRLVTRVRVRVRRRRHRNIIPYRIYIYIEQRDYLCPALRDLRAYKMHTPRREFVRARTLRKCVVLHVALECASINSRCNDDDNETDDYIRVREVETTTPRMAFFVFLPLSTQPSGVPVVVLLYASSSRRDDVGAASRGCRLERCV